MCNAREDAAFFFVRMMYLLEIINKRDEESSLTAFLIIHVHYVPVFRSNSMLKFFRDPVLHNKEITFPSRARIF